MWFATQDGGVVRYDGHDMRILKYEPGSPRSLKSSFVTALALDPNGLIWIGTGEAGCSSYDPATDSLIHYQHSDKEGSLSSDGVNVVYVDAEGTLWVGTTDGILNRLDRATGRFQRIKIADEPSMEITAIAAGDAGLLWIGTSSAGLFKLDAKQGKVLARHRAGQDASKSLSSDSIQAILQDREGMLWVGTDSGLDRLDRKTGSVTHFRNKVDDRTSLSDNRITEILEDKDGALWVGTRNGLNVMSKERRSFIQYVYDPTHPDVTADYPIYVTSAYQDSGGVLWFGTLTGLRKLDKLSMSFGFYPNATGEGDAMTFVDGDPGIIWIGTYGSGLEKFDRNANLLTRYTHLGELGSPEAIKLTEWITALYYDKRDTLWIGGVGLGLVSFDTRTGQHAQFLPDPERLEGLTSDRIERIVADKSGNLWLATWGGGLVQFDPQAKVFSEFMSDAEDRESLSSDYLHTIHIDNRNPDVIWVGTARGGLNRFQIQSQTATHFSLVPQGSELKGYDTILTIYQDGQGVLWLGTDGGGLVRFEPETKAIKYYAESQGLSNSTIYGILPDDSGRLWMGTNGGGLSVFDPKTEKFITYTTADGVVSNVLNQNGYYRSTTGEMLFSGNGGFNLFDPSGIRPDDYVPPVAITKFQLFNKDVELARPIWATPELELGYQDSVFSFEFAALGYAASDMARYAYKLEGMHDWVEVGANRRFVTYNNIDSGDYLFRVKVANRHGIWGESVSTVRISVAPPPWRTWWAYSLYVFAGLGVVAAFLRSQQRKVESLRQVNLLQAMERELELIGVIQTGFLPSSNQLDTPFFKLCGFYRPADRAGGDWWWYEQRGAKLVIIVGDVTGHGSGPAMVTAAAATAFRIQGKSRDLSLTERLYNLNEEVIRVGGGKYQMTVSALELDSETGRFTLYNAGGWPVMHILGESTPKLLMCTGDTMGIPTMQLGTLEGTMAPGDRFILYTDGIPETEISQGRQLGMRRFTMACQQATQDVSVQAAADRLMQEVNTLRQGAIQSDDWTFAIVEWTQPQQPRY